jgi:hypothetical protein
MKPYNNEEKSLPTLYLTFSKAERPRQDINVNSRDWAISFSNVAIALAQ